MGFQPLPGACETISGSGTFWALAGKNMKKPLYLVLTGDGAAPIIGIVLPKKGDGGAAVKRGF